MPGADDAKALEDAERDKRAYERAMTANAEEIGKLTKQLTDMRALLDRKSTSAKSLPSEIQLFHGKFGDNFQDWLDIYEIVTTSLGWEPSKCAQMLPAYLRDVALEAYRPLDNGVKRSYDALKKKLLDILQPAELEKFQIGEILNLKQGPNQPVVEYATVFKKLMRGAWPTMAEAERNKIACQLFINGLQTLLRRPVMDKGFSTVDEAIHEAEKQEAYNRLIAADLAIQTGFTGFNTTSPLHPHATAFALQPTTNKSQPTPPAVKPVQCAATEPKRVRFPSPSPHRSHSASASPERLHHSHSDTIADLQAQVEKLTRRWDGFMRARDRERNGSSSSQDSRKHSPSESRNKFTTDGRPICNSCGKAGHYSYNCRSKTSSERDREKSRSGSPVRQERSCNAALTGHACWGKDSQSKSAAHSDARDAEIEALREQVARLSAVKYPDFTDCNALMLVAYKDVDVQTTDSNCTAPTSDEPSALCGIAEKTFANAESQTTEPFTEKKTRVQVVAWSRVEGSSTLLRYTLRTPPRCRKYLKPSKYKVSLSAALPTVILSLFYALCILPFVNCSFEEGRAYSLCGTSRSGHAIAIPQKITCAMPPLEKLYTVRLELWTPRSHPTRTKAWKCSVHAREICTNVGFFGSRGIVSDRKTFTSIRPEDCLAIVSATDYSWKGHRLVEISPNLWSSNNSLNVDYKWCCRDHCFSTTNLLIEKGEIATFDGRHITSDLGDVGGCSPLSQHCSMVDGIVVWNTIDANHFCEFEFIGTYNATVNGKHLLLEELQIAILMEGQSVTSKSSCLPLGTVITLQGLAARKIFTEFDKPQKRSVEQSSENHPIPTTFATVLPDSANSDTSLNYKLNYLEDKLLRIEQQDFRQVWFELCSLAQRQLDTVWQLLRLDATLGVRALFSRDDIAARFVGDVVYVWECLQVRTQPSDIFWNYQHQGVCYDLLPVRLNSTLYFVIPGTRDLTLHATEVSCAHTLSAIYKHSTGYRTAQGSVHVTTVPAELMWKQHWKPFAFTAPALFNNLYARLEMSVAHLASYAYRLHSVQDQVDRLLNYTAALSLEPDTVFQILRGVGEGFGDGLGKVLEHAGMGLGHAISGVATGASTVVNSLLTGPLQLCINILVIGGATCLLILFCYLLGRYLYKRWAIHHNDREPQHVVDEQHVVVDAPILKPPQQAVLQLAAAPIAVPLQEHIPMVPLATATTGTTTKVRIPTALPVIEESHHENIKFDPWPKRVCVGDTKTLQATIPVQINGVAFMGLADTGSGATLIPERMVEIHRYNRAQEPGAIVRSLSGHQLHSCGTVSVDVRVGSRVIPHVATIVKRSHYDILLGVDFLSKLGPFTFDFERRIFRSASDCLPLCPLSSAPWCARVISTTVLPPRTEVVLPCQLDRPCKPKDPLLVEPRQAVLMEQGILGARALVQPTDNCFLMRLLNATLAPVKLYEGTVIADVVIQSLPDTLAPPVPPYTADATSANSLHACASMPASTDPLQDLNWSTSCLTSQQKSELLAILRKYSDRFSTGMHDLGKTSVLTFKIDTGDCPPVSSRPYRIPESQKPRLKGYIDEMLQAGLIEPSTSPWSSPIIVVKKRDGSDRFCDALQAFVRRIYTAADDAQTVLARCFEQANDDVARGASDFAANRYQTTLSARDMVTTDSATLSRASSPMSTTGSERLNAAAHASDNTLQQTLQRKLGNQNAILLRLGAVEVQLIQHHTESQESARTLTEATASCDRALGGIRLTVERSDGLLSQTRDHLDALTNGCRRALSEVHDIFTNLRELVVGIAAEMEHHA